MSRSDIIADTLTIIRNATVVGKEEAIVPYSKLISGMLQIFKDDGYIDNFKEFDIEGKKRIKVYLRYDGKKSAIRQIKKISKPGRRKYIDKNSIPRVLSGYGTAVISSSNGIIDNNKAKELGVGGEVICYIW
jgi:small subunit ribosomal protein S8